MKWRQIEAARAFLQTETGAIVRDWGGRVPIALVFPNTYTVGMSNLAMHGLYQWLNDLPDVACERAFATLERGKDRQEPVLTLESQRPIHETSLVAFSISYELDYPNVVGVLRRSRIPVLARQRRRFDPLVIMGGPAVSANPSVMGPIADAIMIGEAEDSLDDLVEAGRLVLGGNRDLALDWLADLPGVWVPRADRTGPIQRQWVRDLSRRPFSSSIVCPKAEFGDMRMIEIARGCVHACRFCLATRWYHPFRQLDPQQVLELARQARGRWSKVALVSAAVSDYQEIDALVEALRAEGIAFSVSSLRATPLSQILLEGLAASGARTLTIAPEAGSQRLRDAMRKGISHDDIMRATALASRLGFDALKLYYMVGLPGETEEDIGALIELTREIAERFGAQVIVAITPFIPKAHTPWQRQGMAPERVLDERISRIRSALQSESISIRAESTILARAQAIMARGDEALGEALASSSSISPRHVERMAARAGLDVEAYLADWDASHPLPWHMVDARGCPATTKDL